LKYPVSEGRITHWGSVEKLWNYTFTNILNVKPETTKVLLTVPPHISRADREKMVSLMLGKFKMKSVFTATSDVLAFYADAWQADIDRQKATPTPNPIRRLEEPKTCKAGCNRCGYNWYLKNWNGGEPHKEWQEKCTCCAQGTTQTEQEFQDCKVTCGIKFKPPATAAKAATAAPAAPKEVTIKLDGISVGLGEGIGAVVPIMEGYPLAHAIRTTELAGKVATHYLIRLILQDGHKFTTGIDHETVRAIKENEGVCAYDFDQLALNYATGKEKNVNVTLAAGETFKLGLALAQACEVLFQPVQSGHKGNGIQVVVKNSIMSCDDEIHEMLYSNIALNGGTTAFKGFKERLQRTVQDMAPHRGVVHRNKVPVRIGSYEKPENLAWKGGSLLAKTQAFDPMWITAKDFNLSSGNVVIEHGLL